MNEHPIEGLMTTAMENLKDMTEANTIIGDAIESPVDGSLIIPVSKLGFGFAAGGSEFNGNSSGESGSGDSLPFGGGSGGGVSVTPVAFLIVSPKGIKMIHFDGSTHIYEKLVEIAPKAAEKIQQLLKESGFPGMMKEQSNHQNNNEKGEKQKQESKQDSEKQESRKSRRKSQQSSEDESDQNYDI